MWNDAVDVGDAADAVLAAEEAALPRRRQAMRSPRARRRDRHGVRPAHPSRTSIRAARPHRCASTLTLEAGRHRLRGNR